MTIPARLNVGIMLFFALFFMYMLRSNFSINILAMVTTAGEQPTDDTSPPRYNWSTYEQSLILGAYFWGYAITSLPVGLLTDRYGYAKANVAISSGTAVVLTMLTPLAAASLVATIMLRFVMGLVSGGTLAAIQKLIAMWSPPDERGKFIASFFGTDIGTVITWTVCGLLVEHFGWPWAFYGTGLAGGVFTLLWLAIVYNSPAQHPRIAAAERDYIESSLGHSKGGAEKTAPTAAAGGWPPFGRMLMSLPFWALLLLHYSHIWGMYFLLTAAPMFMNTVLGFDLAATGMLASAPYLLRLITGMGFGALGDSIRARGWMTTWTVRKYATVSSHILPGLLLVAVPFVSVYSPFACVACITLSFGFNGAASLTNYQNVHDLAPNYASTIYSAINAVATTSGFLSPLVVAFFTGESNTIDEWTYIFIVGAVIYIVPSVLFMMCGSADVQPWNEPNAVDMKKRESESEMMTIGQRVE